MTGPAQDTEAGSPPPEDGPPATPPTPWSARERLALAAVPLGTTILCAAAGLFRLGVPSFWYDEAFTVQAAGAGYTSLFEQFRGAEINMALYYVLIRPWLWLGASEWWVRLPSVLLTAASIPLVWLLARRWFGVATATVAGLLLAGNAFAIRYAQEARAYALLLFLATLSTWLLARAFERPTIRRSILYAVVAAPLVYTHILAVFVLAGHALAAAVHRPRLPLRSAGVAALIVGGACIPMALVVQGARGGLDWVAEPTPESIVATLVALVGGERPPGPAAAGLAAAYVLGIVLGLAAGWRDPARRRAVATLVACAAAPIVIPLAASFVTPIFVSRYLIGALPAVTILAALGLATIRPQALRVVAVAVVLSLAVVGLGDLYRDAGKPDWRAAAGYLETRGTPRDRWISLESWTWRPLQLYAGDAIEDRRFPVQVWRGLDSGSPTFGETLGRHAAEAAAEGRTFWVVATPSARTAPRASTDPRLEVFRDHYRMVEEVSFARVVITRFEPLQPGAG